MSFASGWGFLISRKMFFELSMFRTLKAMNSLEQNHLRAAYIMVLLVKKHGVDLEVSAQTRSVKWIGFYKKRASRHGQ